MPAGDQRRRSSERDGGPNRSGSGPPSCAMQQGVCPVVARIAAPPRLPVLAGIRSVDDVISLVRASPDGRKRGRQVVVLALVVLTVATALVFDFTNGFHDTANAMATTIATRALRPRVAVTLAAVMNLLGAFLSVTVAATIASGIVDQTTITVPIIFAGLVGAIVWNVITWYLGIPSSSSHALVGGVVGSVLAAERSAGVIWSGIASKVLIPALLAPFVCGFAAYLA